MIEVGGRLGIALGMGGPGALLLADRCDGFSHKRPRCSPRFHRGWRVCAPLCRDAVMQRADAPDSETRCTARTCGENGASPPRYSASDRRIAKRSVYWRGTIRYFSCFVYAANESLSYLELIEGTLFEAN